MTETQLRTLIDAVEAASTHPDSYLHGPRHWRCVSLLGIDLARRTPGGDPLVAFLFGLFHDAIRENDDFDPDHGQRGADLARVYAAHDLFAVTPPQKAALLRACETHTFAPATSEVAVGVCYDADRLNLWRCGTKPAAKYLSTPSGITMAETEATKTMHSYPPTWDEVLRALFHGDSLRLPSHSPL
jgi:uncharacterized protein